jgi:hypothetical protein
MKLTPLKRNFVEGKAEGHETVHSKGELFYY